MTGRIVLPDGGWGVLSTSRPPVLPPVWEALGLGRAGDGEGGRQALAGPLTEGLPAEGLPAEGLPAEGLPAAGLSTAGLPAEDSVDPLVDAALREMDAVLRSAGPVRDTAFRLLAADALLTWACEVAADAADPGERLAQMVHRMAAGAS